MPVWNCIAHSSTIYAFNWRKWKNSKNFVCSTKIGHTCRVWRAFTKVINCFQQPLRPPQVKYQNRISHSPMWKIQKKKTKITKLKQAYVFCDWDAYCDRKSWHLEFNQIDVTGQWLRPRKTQMLAIQINRWACKEIVMSLSYTWTWVMANERKRPIAAHHIYYAFRKQQ